MCVWDLFESSFIFKQRENFVVTLKSFRIVLQLSNIHLVTFNEMKVEDLSFNLITELFQKIIYYYDNSNEKSKLEHLYIELSYTLYSY